MTAQAFSELVGKGVEHLAIKRLAFEFFKELRRVIFGDAIIAGLCV